VSAVISARKLVAPNENDTEASRWNAKQPAPVKCCRLRGVCGSCNRPVMDACHASPTNLRVDFVATLFLDNTHVVACCTCLWCVSCMSPNARCRPTWTALLVCHATATSHAKFHASIGTSACTMKKACSTTEKEAPLCRISQQHHSSSGALVITTSEHLRESPLCQGGVWNQGRVPNSPLI